jgi:hypothetical protein
MDASASAVCASAATPTWSKVKGPGTLRSLVGDAVREFKMIGEGAKVLVGVSDGKDSMTMLHVLLELQRRSPLKFDIAAATVDPQTPEYDPSALVCYTSHLGVRYHMLSKPIIEMAKTCMDVKRPSLYSFCSRMKHGMLYSCMREHGYTCLALGQHLDDGNLRASVLASVPTTCMRKKHALFEDVKVTFVLFALPLVTCPLPCMLLATCIQTFEVITLVCCQPLQDFRY